MTRLPYEQWIDGARDAVLDALDRYVGGHIEAAQRPGLPPLPAYRYGATDAELPALFAGLDAHMGRVAARINDRESTVPGSAYFGIAPEDMRL